MNDLKRDMAHIQELVGTAFNQTGGLVALGDGGQMSPEKLEKTLEHTMDCFERATLELRRMCETYAPGVGGYQRKHPASRVEAAGYVEQFGYGWVHIVLQTLLPHCRYQTPAWLTDTIRRLLDEYEAGGSKLPCFERAMLVIDEHSGIEGRHIFDQDNKGWKAVSNALKGRLFPDDDQYMKQLVETYGENIEKTPIKMFTITCLRHHCDSSRSLFVCLRLFDRYILQVRVFTDGFYQIYGRVQNDPNRPSIMLDIREDPKTGLPVKVCIEKVNVDGIDCIDDLDRLRYEYLKAEEACRLIQTCLIDHWEETRKYLFEHDEIA